MRYMLLVYLADQAMNDTEREQCYVDSARLTQELDAAGKYLAAAPLQPVSTAASVRVRDGRPLVTDGPFAETREQLAGYYLVDVASQEEAVAIAARIPGARKGTIEVRAILEIGGVPPARNLEEIAMTRSGR
jgi:hypothetical protein